MIDNVSILAARRISRYHHILNGNIFKSQQRKGPDNRKLSHVMIMGDVEKATHYYRILLRIDKFKKSRSKSIVGLNAITDDIARSPISLKQYGLLAEEIHSLRLDLKPLP